ncbi:MAG: two-component regulator propeller domain-containing protein [Cyclobacteriaceae bacterium]
MTKAIKKYLFSALITFVSFYTCHAQNYYFKNLVVEKGLSQEDVSSIVQDSFGFIWIGTYDGLNRFDGRNIETFHRKTSNPASLPDNRISALAEDHKKRLWIGTQAGNFSYYSLLTEEFIRINAPENTGEIREFIVTNDSRILALTSNGILQLNETTQPKFELIKSSQNLHFRDGLQKPNGEILLVGNSGVFLLTSQELKKLPNPDKTLFNTVVLTHESIIAGGDNGIYAIDEVEGAKKLENADLPQSSVTTMLSDQEGDIWIGTINDGLFRFDSALNYISHLTASKTNLRGLISNTIINLYQDQANNLWIGSRQGLSYTNLSTVDFNSIQLDELYRPNIRSLLINENDLLLGITNEGLYRYNLKEDTLMDLNFTDLNFVNHIEKIDKTIYASTDQGLLTISNDYSLDSIYRIPGTPQNAPSNIRCVTSDDHGHVFVGTYKGILLKEGDDLDWIWKDHPFLQTLIQYYVFRMLFDPNSQQLLIGTRSKGLLLLNMDKNGQFTQLITEGLVDVDGNSISNTSVWNFHMGKDKSIWLGTEIGLFRRAEGAELFQQIDVPGVLDRKIMSIAEDANNNLWLSNTHGLIRFNPKTEKVSTFTYEDGLLSSSMTEASGYYGDEIFFGTTNGLNFVNPLEITPNPYNPRLLISNLNINNELVKPGVELFGSIVLNQNINSVEALNLNYLQNNFSLDFSATNFSNISQNNFRYQLNGYDKKWIFTSSNPVISYSNLDPGSYVLELQIEDNEGKWTSNSFILPIEITPAPWKTPLAYALYVIIIGSIIIVLIYFWLQKERLDHQIELDQVKISQDKELREKQLRFFVDVGHEFKTPLSLILAPFNDLTNENLSKEQKNLCLQIVSRNIDRMNFLVHQLLDLGRISEGQKFVKVTQKDLRQSIREYTNAFLWQIQRENIDLRLNLNQCVGYFDNSVLEKGFYNVLSNAFKYTPLDGIVDISLKVEIIDEKDYAIITVSDSGNGIPDDQKAHIFERFYHGKDRASSGIGLHLAHSLIQAHGGSISVEDSELGGAKFKIILPISLNSYTEGEVDSNSIEISHLDSQKDHHLINDETVDKGETILIVEDDYDLRNYLNITLQNDYTILEASNGEQGLFIAQEELPDIIISDIMMPLMDGIEMCQQLKSNKGTSHIPILFLTAKKDNEDQKKGLEVGAWDYITKPFDSEALRRKVNNILETRNRFKTYLLNHNINIDIESHYTSYDQKLLKNINQVIKDNIANPSFTASELASEVGLSRMHLHRKLKTLAGETAKGIITRVKIMYAVDMFDKGCDRVQEAMNAVGITNYGNFNNNFKKIMNITASDYIAKHKDGEAIK